MLNKPFDQRGAAPLESVFAIALLVLLVLGAIEVAFVLYGRNVLISSAHEGARAGIELGRSPAEAQAVAQETVLRSTGRLVRDVDVDVDVTRVAEASLVRVTVRGVVNAFGPVPVAVPVTASASATRGRPLR